MNKGKATDSRFLLYLSLALTILCGFILMVLVDPALVKMTGQGIMDLQFSPSPAKTFFVLQSWGEAGRAFQLHWMWLDYIYPAGYGVFLFLAIRRSLDYIYPTASRLKMAAWLPLFAGALDWAENSAEIYMILHLQAVNRLFTLHRFFVYMKWSAIAVSVILLTGLLLAGLYFRRKPPLSP